MERKSGGYRNLLVWQQAMGLARDCYVVTRQFPREEQYGLSTQIRRAACSVPANIAEGSARRTLKDFASFLCIAQGSLRELETYLLLSVDIGILDEKQAPALLAQVDSVSNLLARLIRSQTTRNTTGRD